MSVELTSAWWKAHKAKTLTSEPLTKALEELDKARHDIEVTATREKLAALMGATKSVQGAIGQTITKCNSVLHKETITNLKQMETMAKAAYTTEQTLQVSFNNLLATFHKLRDAVVPALQHAVDAPSQKTLSDASKLVIATMHWLDTHRGELNSEEVVNTTTWFNKASMALSDALKSEAAGKAADMQKQVDELENQIPRIKTTGGFSMPKGNTISSKPFGQGL